MNKKRKKIILIIMVVLIILLFLVIFLIPKIEKYLELSTLKKYNMHSDEIVTKEFELNNKKYVLTQYMEPNYSYSNNNLLFKEKNDYYLLKTIENCDISEYLKENTLFIHCIGKKGNILKYTINSSSVKKDTIELSYDSLPNISQIHITIENVDEEYIYLKSLQDNFKCSLKTKKCE